MLCFSSPGILAIASVALSSIEVETVSLRADSNSTPKPLNFVMYPPTNKAMRIGIMAMKTH